MNSRLDVGGDVSMNSTLTVSGNVNTTSNLIVKDDVTVNNGDIYVSSGKLYVNSDSVLGGDVSMNSKLKVSGDVSMNSALTVAGNVITTGNLRVTNNVIVTTGDINIDNGSLDVSGNIIAHKQATITGDVFMESELMVNGNAVIRKNVEVLGDLKINTIVVQNVGTTSNEGESYDIDTGAIVSKGGVGVHKNLNVGGNLDVSGISSNVQNLRVKGTLNVAGDSTFHDMRVNGSAKIGNTLYLNTTDTQNYIKYTDNYLSYNASISHVFDKRIGIGISPSYTLDVSGVANVSSKLYVTNNIGVGTTTPGYNLDVSGNARISATLDADTVNTSYFGGTTLNGDITGNSRKITNLNTLSTTYFGGTTLTGDISGHNFSIKNLGTLTTGKIGVGSDSPIYNLDVSGNVSLGVNGLNQLILDASYLYPIEDLSNSTSKSGLGIFWNVSGKSGETVFLNKADRPSDENDIGGFSFDTVDVSRAPVKLFSSTRRRFWVNTQMGINTPDPAYNLDVSGVANVSSKLYVTNNIGVGTTEPAYKLDVSGTINTNDKLYVTNNIGVGTTAPAYKLDVSGTINTNDKLYVTNNIGVGTTLPAFNLDVSGIANMNNKLYVTNNIGVGTTAPAYKLDVSGTINTNDKLYVTNNIGVGTTAPAYKLDVSGTINTNDKLYVTNNIGVGTTAPAYKLDVSGTINTNDKLYVTNNIGVGTTAPAYKLDVSGTINTNDKLYVTNNIGVGTTAPAYNLDVSGVANMNNQLYVKNNIGVGTTAPAYKLDVSGTINTNDKLYVTNNIGVGTTAPAYKLDVRGIINTNDKLYVTNNIGVGTTAPAYKLDVSGTINTNDKLYVTNNIGVGTTAPAYKLDVRGIINTNDKLYVTNNIGVGTTEPAYKLDVSGIANVSDNLYVKNNVGVGTIEPAYNLDVSGNIRLGYNSLNEFVLDGSSSYPTVNTSGLSSTSGLGVFWNLTDSVGETVFLNKAQEPGGVDRGGFFFNTVDNYFPPEELFACTSQKFWVNKNVAINKSDPSYNFDVSGIAVVSDSLYVGKNICIGREDPIYNLDVVGNAGVDETLYVGNTIAIGIGDPAFNLDVSGIANMNNKLYVTNNIGVGTTLPAFNLDVSGTSRLYGTVIIKETGDGSNPDNGVKGTEGSLIIEREQYGNSSILFRSINSGKYGYINYRDDGTLNNRLIIGIEKGSGSQRQHIILYPSEGNGYVGINTMNPGYNLDVNGIIKTNDKLYVTNNIGVGTTEPAYKLDVSGTINTNDKLYVTNNIGVGTTEPAYKLDVSGIARVTTNLFVKSYHAIRTYDNILLGDSSNVLIGTAPLHVGGSLSDIGDFSSLNLNAMRIRGNKSRYSAVTITGTSSDNNAQSLILAGGGTDVSGCGIVQAKDLYLNSSIPLLLNPDGGFVGINKSNPACHLDISGAVTTGALTVNGAITARTNTITTSGAVTTGALTVNGAITAGTNTITTSGAVTTGGLTVNGAITAGTNTITTSGAVTTGALTVNGAITAGTNTITTSGAVTTGVLTVNGAITAGTNTITTSGAVTTGVLTVNGAITAGTNTITTSGAVTTGDLTVNGAITASGDIVITNTGRIGIGTRNPAFRLDVNGGVRIIGTTVISESPVNANVWAGATLNPGAYVGICNLHVGGNLAGIGTTSPYNLSFFGMNKGSYNGMSITCKSSDASGSDTLLLGSGGKIGNGCGYIQALNTFYNNKIKLLLNPNGGNVGINQSIPDATLDVNGYAKIFGDITYDDTNLLSNPNFNTPTVGNYTIYSGLTIEQKTSLVWIGADYALLSIFNGNFKFQSPNSIVTGANQAMILHATASISQTVILMNATPCKLNFHYTGITNSGVVFNQLFVYINGTRVDRGDIINFTNSWVEYTIYYTPTRSGSTTIQFQTGDAGSDKHIAITNIRFYSSYYKLDVNGCTKINDKLTINGDTKISGDTTYNNINLLLNPNFIEPTATTVDSQLRYYNVQGISGAYLTSLRWTGLNYARVAHYTSYFSFTSPGSVVPGATQALVLQSVAYVSQTVVLVDTKPCQLKFHYTCITGSGFNPLSVYINDALVGSVDTIAVASNWYEHTIYYTPTRSGETIIKFETNTAYASNKSTVLTNIRFYSSNYKLDVGGALTATTLNITQLDGTKLAGTLDANYNNITNVRTLTAGNVGIGTTTPTKILDVSGDANVSGTISAGTVSAGTLTAGTFSPSSITASGLISTNGSLCAGGTNANGYKLYVTGNSYMNGQITSDNQIYADSFRIRTLIMAPGGLGTTVDFSTDASNHNFAFLPGGIIGLTNGRRTVISYDGLTTFNISVTGTANVSGILTAASKLVIVNYHPDITASDIGVSSSIPIGKASLHVGGNLGDINNLSPLSLNAMHIRSNKARYSAITIAANGSDWDSQSLILAGGGDQTYSCGIIQAKDLHRNSCRPLFLNPDGGNVMIGSSSNPAYTLDVNGNCRATNFYSGSDYRLKESIVNLKETTYTVDKLRPIKYQLKDDKTTDIGFLAHEVQEEFPFLVSGEKDGKEMQSLNYTGLIGVLVKEIQCLKAEREKQDNLILSMIRRIEILESRIN
jgi:uncharacterized membrane protein